MHSRSLPRGLAVAASVTLLLALTLVVTTATAQRDEPQSSPPANAICFAADYALACVNRPALNASGTLTDQVRSLIDAMLLGPTTSEQAQGIRSALPADAKLADVSVIDQRVVIDLVLPDRFLAALIDDQVEAINEQFSTTFTTFNFQRLDVQVRDASGNFKPLSTFLPPIAIPKKESGSAPAVSMATGKGLTGKTVFVSAGHGWYWYNSALPYNTQRPVYPTAPYPAGEGIVEDFNNAEAVNQYLLKYLGNSGADAWTVRERDMNTNMIIVDDASADFVTQGAWTTASGGYNNTYRFAATSAAATTTATWTFTPTLANTYAVYVHFPNTTTQRIADAHFSVEHAGGATPAVVLQTRDGDNWRFIGNYPFYAGQTARVRVTNQSATTGAIVLADAVRIGGGIGDTLVGTALLPSNKPRWEEQSRQYAKWVGMPNVDNLNDVIVRPIYSEWEKESGEDAVYIAWHTNGYNGYNTTARGTESYIHSFQPTPGSDVLQNFVHTALLSGIQTAWDPTWPDRGEKSQDLGELRLLSTMPGVLIENGFHDNPTDVESLKDPRFMQISARAIYHGLVKYWNSIDPNVPLVYLPEPPTRLIVKNTGVGQVTLNWQPGPTDAVGVLGSAATAYRVYTSADGFGWDNGTEVSTTTYVLNGLMPNQLIYFKVTGVNAGGESFAAPVLAARAASRGLAPLLIVYGFDRIDKYGDTQQYDGPDGLNRRVFVDRINRFDYIIQHATAITLPFDSAQHAAISDGAIGLGNYTLVDWLAGEEQSPFPSLTASDQSQLNTYLGAGGALFISGSEIGFELKNTAFYANVLRASFMLDSAGTYGVAPTANGIFSGLSAFNFDDGTHGTYNVDFPDVFLPINSATSALVYNTGGSAAIQYRTGCSGLVYSGVPFESIYPAATRQAVMNRIINYLGTCLPLDIDTTITSPVDNAMLNAKPAFSGETSSNATSVQVSVRRVSDTTFYNGTIFAPGPEVWLAASGVNPWSYSLPALLDGPYALRARALGSGPITDTTPAAITFTLDTIAPITPTLITPTGGISMVTVAPRFVWQGESIPGGIWNVDIDGTLHQVFELASPPGITPTTETLTVTWPVTAGLHQWRIKAVDAAGNQSAWSNIGAFSTSSLKVYLPIVVKNYTTTAPPAGSCSDIAVNGGFETGDFSGWSLLATNPPAAIVTNTVYAGQYAARVGKLDASTTLIGFSSIQQNTSIPANAITATLSFARYRYSGDLTNLQYVAVMSGTTVADYLVYDQINDQQWLPNQFDLLPYAGQTIGLRFSVWNKNPAAATGMIVDDVKLIVCTP